MREPDRSCRWCHADVLLKAVADRAVDEIEADEASPRTRHDWVVFRSSAENVDYPAQVDG